MLPTLIAKALVKYYRNVSQFDIQLINGQGNPVSGKMITMNINGVLYNREYKWNDKIKYKFNSWRICPNSC